MKMDEEDNNIAVLFTLVALWSFLSSRRRTQSSLFYSSLMATVLPYDRAGRILPVSEHRNCDWWNDDVVHMSEHNFRDHFRLKRSVFERLQRDRVSIGWVVDES